VKFVNIIYSTELADKENLFELYECLDWNSFLQLDGDQLLLAMKQSWYVLYVYDDDKLIGTGRVVSDGVINAYICGLGVHPEYRHKGIGTEIMRRLVEQCESSSLHFQFFCEEHLVPFYENMGFKPLQLE
jgi:GNAT superfamily N-acetyltransferase